MSEHVQPKCIYNSRSQAFLPFTVVQNFIYVSFMHRSTACFFVFFLSIIRWYYFELFISFFVFHFGWWSYQKRNRLHNFLYNFFRLEGKTGKTKIKIFKKSGDYLIFSFFVTFIHQNKKIIGICTWQFQSSLYDKF